MSAIDMTIDDLAKSVMHSDSAPRCLRETQAAAALDIATKKLGVACFGRRTVRLALSNGHHLLVTLESPQ